MFKHSFGRGNAEKIATSYHQQLFLPGHRKCRIPTTTFSHFQSEHSDRTHVVRFYWCGCFLCALAAQHMEQTRCQSAGFSFASREKEPRVRTKSSHINNSSIPCAHTHTYKISENRELAVMLLEQLTKCATDHN